MHTDIVCCLICANRSALIYFNKDFCQPLVHYYFRFYVVVLERVEFEVCVCHRLQDSKSNKDSRINSFSILDTCSRES